MNFSENWVFEAQYCLKQVTKIWGRLFHLVFSLGPHDYYINSFLIRHQYRTPPLHALTNLAPSFFSFWAYSSTTHTLWFVVYWYILLLISIIFTTLSMISTQPSYSMIQVSYRLEHMYAYHAGNSQSIMFGAASSFPNQYYRYYSCSAKCEI